MIVLHFVRCRCYTVTVSPNQIIIIIINKNFSQHLIADISAESSSGDYFVDLR